MKDMSAAAHARVELAQDYYKHVWAETFPRVRAVISSASAFAAAVSPTPTLQATFAVVSLLSTVSAATGHYTKDAFGMSNSVWLKIASRNLDLARSNEASVLRQEQEICQDLSRSSVPKLDLGRF
ncbi:MAG: hypothetical protein RBR86_03195 [Pseudobdellovibrionaceae bacterium]|jgi:hypothetical protein|nr:hypothetical protein [Pseudobdellovibrionaceae bacterium]